VESRCIFESTDKWRRIIALAISIVGWSSKKIKMTTEEKEKREWVVGKINVFQVLRYIHRILWIYKKNIYANNKVHIYIYIWES